MTNDLKFPKWQEPYLEALMETDERKLGKRVKLAESAILMRLRAIQSDSDTVEKQAIEDALNGLSSDKVTQYKFALRASPVNSVILLRNSDCANGKRNAQLSL